MLKVANLSKLGLFKVFFRDHLLGHFPKTAQNSVRSFNAVYTHCANSASGMKISWTVTNSDLQLLQIENNLGTGFPQKSQNTIP